MKILVYIAQSIWINYHADPEIRVRVFPGKKEAEDQLKAWDKNHPVDDLGVRPMDLAGMEVVSHEINIDLFDPSKPIFYKRS